LVYADQRQGEKRVRKLLGRVWHWHQPGGVGWENPDFKLGGIALSPFFGYYNSEKRGNNAHIIPIGMEALWELGDDKNFRPYAGLGLSLSAVKFEDRDAGVKTGWKAVLGGRIVLGADINKWLNIQASYSLMSDIAGYNFSGFSIGAGITFYF
jgi:outer membrane protein W